MKCNDLICLIFPSLATFEASFEDEEGGAQRAECDDGEDRLGKGAKAGKWRSSISDRRASRATATTPSSLQSSLPPMGMDSSHVPTLPNA